MKALSLFIAAIAALSLFGSGTAASTPTSDPREWVKVNRPTALAWESFDQKLLEAMKGKTESIGVIYGHFYTDKFTDVALLSKQNDRLVFEIVRCNPLCAVDLRREMRGGMEGIRFVGSGLTYLAVVPKGRLVETTPAIEGEDKHVKLKHDAIQVATFQKAAVVWYWDQKTKEWDTVSTAD